MTIIIPANSAADTAYSVDNSCRFNDADNPRFARTSDTPDNADKYTLSVWLKRGDVVQTSNYHYIMSFDTGGNPREHIRFNDSTALFTWYHRNASGTAKTLHTNAVYRDPSAWMHVCCIYDSSQGTEANRQKVFINGTQITSWNQEEYVAQNEDSNLNNASNNPKIGCLGNAAGTTGNFDGYMAEFHFVDGVAKAATDFGEFDSDSPTIWKPKEYDGSHGTNGWYLDFEDSSALGNDVSGNNNDVVPTGLDAVDQSLDSPTNNFAILNPLMITATNGTISEGNTTWTRSGNWVSIPANFGMTAGKWYWEVRGTSSSGDVSQATGIALGPTTATQTMADWNMTNVHLGDSNQPDAYGHWSTGTLTRRYNNNTNSTYGAGTGASTVIIQVAFDADNGTIWIGKDGTWMDSATQGEIEAGTTTNAMYSGITVNNSNPYFPAVSCENNSAAFNFGGGAFGGTAISSGNADGNGYGNFEFAPPSGYLALCTKNLGSDGG